MRATSSGKQLFKHMKQTLITLAALAMASVAVADTTWTELDTDVRATYKSTWEGCYYYDLTFSVDFTFSVDSLEKGTSAIVAYVTDGRTDGNVVQYTYVLQRSEAGDYTMTFGRTNATNVLADLSYSSGGSEPTQALTAGRVYTISADDTYTGSRVSWKENDTVAFNTRYYDDYVAVNTSLVSSADEAGAATKVVINQAFAVPEPATATLSLLALAGLASRRRRK